MIKKVSLENFESHKKSSYEFKPGFNLIVGENDTGKSAIIRAMRLVAGNEWNTDSLRIGETNAKVIVETDVGSVMVVRGKNNEWTVDNKGSVEKFSKIGKNILPQASEVIGMKPIKVGSTSMLVNIMNQLEGHFMLSEIEGETATGSMRAQVIDELSGLNGIEDLVREIGGDSVRHQKEIKEIDDQVQSLKQELHSEALLEGEEKFIKILVDIYNKVLQNNTKIGLIKSLLVKYEEVQSAIVKNELALCKIFCPNIVLNKIRYVEEQIKKVQVGLEMIEEQDRAAYTYKGFVENLKSIKYPDIQFIEGLIENTKKYQKMNQYATKISQLKKSIRESSMQLAKMSIVEFDFDLCQENIEKRKKALEFTKKVESFKANLNKTEQNLNTIEKQCAEAEAAYSRIKSSIGVCPVCESILK